MSDCFALVFPLRPHANILHIHIGEEGNDIQHPFLVAFRAKYWRFARSFDLYGFSRLDFGNALTAQIERSLHTNIHARVKI